MQVIGIRNTKLAVENNKYYVETPCNYLKYYLGYLNFLDLKKKQQEKSGSSFDIREFHRKVLTIGPVQFPVLEKYMQ